MQEKTSSKTAIITGGASGIGKAVAKKFSEEGIKVFVADKEVPADDESEIAHKQCDVSNAEDVDGIFSWFFENEKSLDILVLCAGQGIQEKLTEGDPEKWQQVINTNLMGALRFVRAFVPQMQEREKGNVVFVSSVSANQPHPYGGIYSASKTALEVVAETLRLETIPHINVSVVSPGVTDTNFFENQISGSSSVESINMGSIAPEDIAEDIFYAISKKSGSINKIVSRPLSQNF